MRHFFLVGWLLVVLFLALGTCAEAAMNMNELPPQLAPWQSWVLHGQQQILCPSRYNDGATVECFWPSRLNLELSIDGGKFEQTWQVFAEGWVTLPGCGEIWPESVLLDGQPAAVVARGDIPSMRLLPGEHRIMGRFFWSRLPEMMPVPPSLGLISLSLDGRVVSSPVIDEQGRLWLQKRSIQATEQNALKVQVFRLLVDAIPMQVVTLLRLDVSGKAREIELPDALLEGSTPMALESPLPARMLQGRGLTLQARPGRWEVRVRARLAGPQFKISAGPCPYGDEIWSFQPRHDLRMVEILDLPPVEPSQTEMPAQWHAYQAFMVKPESAMVLKELRRGDPDPAPDQLSLARTWWLDFNGRGMTVHDEISGTLSRQWYLAMNGPALLGRVSVDGVDRVITQQGEEKKSGVELRHGRLQMQADARIPERSSSLSAVGWDHDFQSVGAALNLPPGWRLLAATGVDSVSDTWLQRWSLLDFFLVLIITLGVFRLRSLRWAAIALAAMALIFHEPDAPRLVWLHLLAALALLPLLPAGWFRRLVGLYGLGAAVTLLIIVVPFVVQQIRWGIYPQLAPAGAYYEAGAMDFVVAKKMVQAESPAAPFMAPEEEEAQQGEVGEAHMNAERQRAEFDKMGSFAKRKDSLKEESPEMMQAAKDRIQATPQQDPDALIPTGPGLPNWQWQRIDLGWSGPVAKDQTLRLYLLSPVLNLLLAFLRVGLLAALIWVLLDVRAWWRRLQEKMGVTATALWILVCWVAVPPTHAPAATNEFPPPALLDELRQRLLEKPDCLPQCADISRMEMVAGVDQLQLTLKVNCAHRVAVPLSVNNKSWTPGQIMLDNTPIGGLYRDAQGQLWGLVPAGLHTLVLLGNVSQENRLQIPLPLKPHMASYSAQGWSVEGIQADGQVGPSIQLLRLQAESNHAAERGNAALPPFLNVERVLHLGLTWQVTTTVTRLTSIGSPVVISIPLLASESVTTAGIVVENGQALINMASDQKELNYQSGLAMATQIELVAPRAVPWSETWILDASPVWHCEFEGIAPIHRQDSAGLWQPQWQPWPEEKVLIHVQRPAAAPGQTKTIDQAALVLTPGARFGIGELSLSLRTSRGGQHTIIFPPKADLQLVTVNGQTLPVRQEGDKISIPLQPGQNQIGVQWHQLAPFASLYRVPPVDIGQAAVNGRITVRMPDQRWILLAGGPRWGPAVLFWSYLAAIVLAALLLTRWPLTPLKGWQWVLLGLGLTQIPAPLVLLVVGWLLALGLRQRKAMPRHWLPHNSLQIGLVVLTLAALVVLYLAVQAGLAGSPEMQIQGNDSNFRTLHWTQGQVGQVLPQPWVLSLPVWVYRLLMLAWSLWLVVALLGWLKWGWQCLNKDGGWRKAVWRRQTAE
ncbi:MAG: hypothetical protein M0036_13095 [Desulfobacteraceae bacterium]|nr:hypothetical protein [Desulfobacteraceae bacterium]